MAKRKGASKHQQVLFAVYKAGNRSLVNRTKRLEKYVKNNPNDKQAKEALKKGLVNYRRKTPYVKKWSPVDRVMAQLYKRAGLNGDSALTIKTYY